MSRQITGCIQSWNFIRLIEPQEFRAVICKLPFAIASLSLLEHRLNGPTPIFESVGLGYGHIIFISSKCDFPRHQTLRPNGVDRWETLRSKVDKRRK